MISAPFRILIVAGVCVLALIGLVVREGMARASGTEIILPMEAVDPRSLLSGHYVLVNLQTTTSADVCANFPPVADGEAWLIFKEAPQPEFRVAPGENASDLPRPVLGPVAQFNTRAEAVRSANSEHFAERGEQDHLIVRGSASCSPQEDGQSNLRINLLGIDRFYIDQANAEHIDEILRTRRPGEAARVFAIVSAGADGRARLKGLLVDGERLELI